MWGGDKDLLSTVACPHGGLEFGSQLDDLGRGRRWRHLRSSATTCLTSGSIGVTLFPWSWTMSLTSLLDAPR